MRVTIMRAQRSHAHRASWRADTALSITRPLARDKTVPPVPHIGCARGRFPLLSFSHDACFFAPCDLDRCRCCSSASEFGVAGLTAHHLIGPPIAGAVNIDELIPTALIFFAVAAALGWIGNRFWPEDWMYNPLL